MKQIPDSWVLSTVGQITLSVNTVEARRPDDRVIQYIDIGSIDNQRNMIAEPKQINLASAPSRARQIVKSGDVLFATVRPYLRNIAQVPGSLDGEIASTGFAVLRPAEGVEPGYLFYKAISRDFVAALTGEQYGVSYPAVKDEQVRAQPVELPPTNEQRRIVAKIEELFSELDKAVESLATAREQLKAYRQCLLKQAFEGKLTSEWRTENRGSCQSAKQLLEVIGNANRSGVKPRKNIQPLTEEQMAQLPVLPQGWTWCKLKELTIKITDGEHFRPETTDSGVYFLSAKDVREHGVSLDDPLFINEETATKARLRCDPEKGDILIVSRGATVGRMCVVNIDDIFCLLGSVILLKISPEMPTSFLIYALKSPRIYRSIITTSGSTAQQAIYLRDVQHVPIPICCIEEQKEIISILDRKLEAVDVIEAEIQAGLARAAVLRQSILKQAFSGQLVAQDPSDEPASVLLERIHTEQGAGGSTKRRNNKNGKKEAA